MDPVTTSPSDAAAGSPRRQYRDRAARFAAERDRLAGVSGRLSHLRTAAFLLLIVAGLFVERRPGVPATVAAVVVFVAFVALIVAHNRVRRRERWNGQLVAYNEEGQYRLDRAWDRLPQHTPARDIAGHAYAGDLDLFGRASLTQILGPVGSAHGIATLDEWLLGRAAPAEILERQAAVRELARLPDLREALALNARRTREVRQSHIERFLTWAEGGPWLRRVRLLRVASFLVPLTTWVLLGLWVFGVVEAALWLIPVLAAAATFYLATVVRIRRTLDQAFGRDGMLAHYPELLAIVTHATFDAPLLQRIRQRLEQEGEPADHQLARLRRMMHLADVRLSMIHFPLYLVTMWDVHVLAALEKWQAVSGSAVRDWLRAIGELEALASLATLAHDQPEWTFAEIVTSHEATMFVAEGLGHPLLSDDDRVTNDVSVGPPGTFLLVTGSNMSGKSTLLRSIGANVVLAQAGAPSCARKLRMPPLEVCTSIRVQDSLARGVSYFMAELERLKQIVDAAERTRQHGDATLLYLLDEILHGTNTAERRIAARRVIHHLVRSGAIGAVTTHDLELADEPLLAPSAQLVHFQEVFGDDEGADGKRGTADEEGGRESRLNFDYRLRQGLATSTNALKLMRIIGLPGEDDEPLATAGGTDPQRPH
ncbi:MutS family DNA mismatch repair protein [soil metagenome]